jgi:hypothetical protein
MCGFEFEENQQINNYPQISWRFIPPLLILIMGYHLDHDWAYIYFLIPAILSFLFSVAVIITALSRTKIQKKKFDQLTLLIACFSIIQSLSWLRARYERHSVFCEIQEYLFQISTLFESYLSIIICATIYHTIRYGKTPQLSHFKMLRWLIIPLLSFFISCTLGSARLFCPFNYHHNLYFPNLSSSSSTHLQQFIAYLSCYLFPMALSWILSAYYSYLTSHYALDHYSNKITTIASQLRLYPIVLALCMLPISTFFFIVVIFNREVHILLFIGAVLVNSTGTINGIVYLAIVRHSSKKSRNRSQSLDHRRVVNSVNYHLIISKLIKSSGQSYNFEENATTDLLHDGERGAEAVGDEGREDQGDWSDDTGEGEDDADDQPMTSGGSSDFFPSSRGSSHHSSFVFAFKDAFTLP